MKKLLVITCTILTLVFALYIAYVHFRSPLKSNVSFETVAFDEYCYPFTQVALFQHLPNNQQIDTEFIINTNDEYQELLQYRRTWEGDCASIQSDMYRSMCYKSRACADVSLPEIDFSKDTLLGYFTSGSCVTKDFRQYVYRDDENNSYTLAVKPINFGLSCSGPPGASMNWVVMPKIPPEYQVMFHY